MKRFLILGVLCAIAACAANSGVVATGPDTFMVSRQAATGFSGLGTLKADAIKEAGAYCAAHSKVVNVLNSSEAKPPYILGNFPKADVEFTCTTPKQ